MVEFLFVIILIVVFVLLFGKADSKKYVLNQVGLDLSEKTYENKKENEFAKYCVKAMKETINEHNVAGNNEMDFLYNLDNVLDFACRGFKYERIKIHLFSNILDVEAYSMRHLIEIVKQGVKGYNHMICVSPYISDIKTARFDSFVNSFSMMPQFDMLFQDVALRGEWANSWTKFIKTFKVVL